MAVYEVAFGVNAPRDGWLIDVHPPPGKYWDQTDLIAYFNLDRPLPDFGTLPQERQDSITAMLTEVKWLLDASTTADDVAMKYYKRLGADVTIKANRIIADALYHKDLAGSLGLDSNWGQGDLISLGTALMDLTEQQVRDLRTHKTAVDGKPLEQREWIIDYAAEANPGTINKWRDPADRVVLDRGMTPWTWSGVVVAG